MKQKLLLAFLSLLATLPICAQTFEYEYEGQTLKYYIDGAYGCYVDCQSSDLSGEVIIPGSIVRNGKEYYVMGIGQKAFSGCSNITSVIMPSDSHFYSIGTQAFERCTSLTSVEISKSVSFINPYAFSYCSSLSSISLPESIKSIGVEAFYYCKALKSISLPNTITEIRDLTFCLCLSLTSISFPDSLKTIGKSAFSGCQSLTSINLPNKITSIGENAFRNCVNLSSITFANSLKRIGSGAFYGCLGLESVNLADSPSLTETGEYSFKGCTKLSTITLPNSITTISKGSFEECSAINELLLPNSVIKISEDAFNGCKNLNNISIPKFTRIIEPGAFRNCENLNELSIDSENQYYMVNDDVLFTKSGSKIIFCLTCKRGEYVIPSTVNIVSDYAFENCTNITAITVPSAVTSIGANCFAKCGLKSLRLNSNTCQFHSDAFSLMNTNVIVLSPFVLVNNIKSLYSGEVHPYDTPYEEIQLTPSYYCTKIHLSKNNFYEGTDWHIKGSLICNNSKINELNIDVNKEIVIDCPYQDSNYSLSISYENGTQAHAFKTKKCQAPSIYLSSTSNPSIKINLITAPIGDEFITPQIFVLTDGGEKYVEYMGGAVEIKHLQYLTFYDVAYALYEYKEHKYIAEVSAKSGDIYVGINYKACPTSVILDGIYDSGATELKEANWNVSNVTDNHLTVSGLKPSKSYSYTYTITTKDGYKKSASVQFATPALEMETLLPRGVSERCAIVAAKTNISDVETSVGFQWKKYDAPESLKPNEGYAAVRDGMIEGYLKNLQPTSYYNVRAFYKDAEGEYYYGDWVTFDPSDFSFFEPTVCTYPAEYVTQTQAQIRGYALPGTDDIESQGFQYWLNAPAQSRAAAEIHTIEVSGQVMNATLTDLLPGRSYCFRAYAKTKGGYVYGDEQTFTTESESTIEEVETETAEPEIIGYYDMSGRRYDSPRKGVNIVRYSDGTARKILAK